MAWPLTRHEGAGRSAEREYRRLAKAWRRRFFGRLSIAIWAVLLLALLGSLFVHGSWGRLTTAFAVALIALWLVIRDLPPDHIARWQRGAWGEQHVAKLLRSLENEGWVIRHDLETSRANRDHVLVGTNGVYLLDTKNHANDHLTLEGDSLRVRRIDQPRDSYLLDRLGPAIRGAAKQLSDEIKTATGIGVFVQPVVVLHGHFEARAQEANGVFYVNSDHIVEWLKHRPVRLTAQRRGELANWLRRL